jgi:phenylalanyl-tRNA synthetase beta chain
LFGQRQAKSWQVPKEAAWTFQDALVHVVAIGKDCGLKLNVLDWEKKHPWTVALHPHRRAQISSQSGALLGWVAELHPKGLRAFEIEERVIGFELNLATCLRAQMNEQQFTKRVVKPLKFQTVKRDFAFQVLEAVKGSEMTGAVHRALEELVSESRDFEIKSVHVFDVYRGGGVPIGSKSMAVRVEIDPTLRTLNEPEILRIQNAILSGVKAVLGVEVKTGA